MFEILVELILGDVEGLNFIVGLQANQQWVQAFRCDLVRSNLEIFELHLLRFEARGQVLEALIVQFCAREVQSYHTCQNGREGRDSFSTEIIEAEVQALQLDPVWVAQLGKIRKTQRSEMAITQIDFTDHWTFLDIGLNDAIDDSFGAFVSNLVLPHVQVRIGKVDHG